jgi:NAD(P)H dehydrogenase (quinone)
MLPLLHHGMLIVGVPYTETALMKTRSGGTPYGPSHWSGMETRPTLSTEEKQLCRSLGRRLAEIAQRLVQTESR